MQPNIIASTQEHSSAIADYNRKLYLICSTFSIRITVDLNLSLSGILSKIFLCHFRSNYANQTKVQFSADKRKEFRYYGLSTSVGRVL